MRTIFVLITVLVSFNSFARATDTSDSPSCAVTGVAETNSGLSNILKVGNSFSEVQFKNVVRSICAEIDSSRIANRRIPQFYKFFKVHGVYKGPEEGFTPFLHNFLNQNKQKLVCPDYLGIKPQLFFKRMFELSLAGFFEDYIIDPELKDLDLNAYEIVNGKKETLLDFINIHLEKGRGDSDTLIFIRDTLHEEYGAKFGAELD